MWKSCNKKTVTIQNVTKKLLQKLQRNGKGNWKWKKESGKRKVEMVILRAQVSRKTEVITAVWRNSWFCLSWKILRIFQLGFSKLFFLNCRCFAKRRNVTTQCFPAQNFSF